MLEIETLAGWVCIPLQQSAEYCFDGSLIHVADDPATKGFQALLRANGGAAMFKAKGSIKRCSVGFSDMPILEKDKIGYCVLRLISDA